MKNHLNIKSYITKSSDSGYDDLILYINTNGADYETKDNHEASAYLAQLNSNYQGELHIIYIEDSYKFIMP